MGDTRHPGFPGVDAVRRARVPGLYPCVDAAWSPVRVPVSRTQLGAVGMH